MLMTSKFIPPAPASLFWTPKPPYTTPTDFAMWTSNKHHKSDIFKTEFLIFLQTNNPYVIFSISVNRGSRFTFLGTRQWRDYNSSLSLTRYSQSVSKCCQLYLPKHIQNVTTFCHFPSYHSGPNCRDRFLGFLEQPNSSLPSHSCPSSGSFQHNHPNDPFKKLC